MLGKYWEEKGGGHVIHENVGIHRSECHFFPLRHSIFHRHNRPLNIQHLEITSTMSDAEGKTPRVFLARNGK